MSPSQPVAPKPVAIPVDELLLDAKNPRLLPRAVKATPKEVLRVLWTDMAVDEVALSIAANGYYPHEEPFVVKEKGKYVVVEGNRRVAAVKLLRSEGLREELKATDLPQLDDEQIAELDTLDCLVFPDRESLWAYCGFQHVNGAKPWDALSKAAFIAEVYESYERDLDEIARRIGDHNETVKRLFRGYRVLKQAEKETGFRTDDISGKHFSFSHLYTALSYSEFRDFLRITGKSQYTAKPVPKSKHENLSDLMRWLYGSDSEDVEPVIASQHEGLGKLKEVLRKPPAISALRGGQSLDRAHAIGIGDERLFREALDRAKAEVQQAKAYVTTGDDGGDEAFETIRDIVDVSQSILSEMTQRREEQ